MKQGFVKVASATPRIRVADPVYNAQVICEQAKEAAEHGAKIVVFPELCITGYTCNDCLRLQKRPDSWKRYVWWDFPWTRMAVCTMWLRYCTGVGYWE